MLKLSDLARRPDLQIDSMLVSPARRLVEGPGGYVHLEPLIMQVFLQLLDAGGKVVTRTELFDQCWGGVYVGDDSLNRAIAKVRQAGAKVAPGLFEIETIPRTGYRLTGEITASPLENLSEASPPKTRLNRRQVTGATLGIIAFGGISAWVARETEEDRKFDALMRVGAQPIRNSGEFDLVKSRRALEEAVRLRPNSARAWGLLAFAMSPVAQGVDSSIPAYHDSANSEAAARRALALNPKEPNALLAMFELEAGTLDWFTRDRRLRQIIAIDPTHVYAMEELLSVLQSLGMNRESLAWTDHALTFEPLSIDLLNRRALKLWITGRVADADKLIDQVRGMAPTDLGARFVRLLILATTGRAGAALAMLNSGPSTLGPPRMLDMWRSSLIALDSRAPAAIANARQACFDAAKTAGRLATHGAMLLSALDEVDAAFEVAAGFLLWRGPVVRQGPTSARLERNDAQWRTGVQWLFTPPCKAMRADKRFLPLCDAIGLIDYWQRRGVKPDYMFTEH